MLKESLAKEQIESPNEFKKIFLLKFTKELIKHSASGEVLELKNILKEEKKEHLKKEKRKIPKILIKREPLAIFEKNMPLQGKIIKHSPRPIMKRPHILRIPEPKLPPHLGYLKPTPTANVEIELGKLNPLIKDPAVKVIESNPDEKVIVMGTMGRKTTNIILNKEEIKRIIEKFSESAKIPVHEGVFRIVFGKLILSAIVSDIVGSKFTIKKMIYSPVFRR